MTTNDTPRAMDPAKLRTLASTPTGRSMIAQHLTTLRDARAEYVDQNQHTVESMRAGLAKAEATIAHHLATVDGHIAACEQALAAAGELQA